MIINFSPYEPRQFYEQTFFSGHPSPERRRGCCRIFSHEIRTDDLFFVENRLLFRRAESLPQFIRYHNDDIENEIPLTRPPVYYSDDIETETSTQIKEKHFIITVWHSWLCRIQEFFNKLTNKDIKYN